MTTTVSEQSPHTSPRQSPVSSRHNTASIAWKDIQVKTKAGRPLLNGISGVAIPGEVVALMGASGAGKTTLLNTLLQRNLRGLEVKGEILVNGQNIGRGVTAVSAYVQQEDMFVGRLTVREHLSLQAALRLPASMNAQQRRERVDQVLKDMLLEGSQGSRIGIPGISKGISGGEMKRLAFATEMINNPLILFCDEPTTGLDSYMAMTIVQRLESLAAQQAMTIVCTIHQPSSEVFELFDKVVFLAQGRVAFHGSACEAVLFFAESGYMIPDHTNPADHCIDTLAIWPEKVEECKQRCNEICDKFAKSRFKMVVDNTIEREEKPRQLTPHQRASLLMLIYSLFMRYFRDNLRHPAVLRAKVLQKVVMAVFLGILYWRITDDLNQDTLMSLMGALFYYCSELTYATVFGIQACMPSDFPLLVREYHDGIYPVFAYFIARVLSYLPIFTIDGVLLVLISYFMVGLKATRIMQMMFTCMLLEWNVVAMGVAIVSVAPSYAIAVSVTGPILTVLSITGGIFTNVAEIPGWIRWVQYLSWFRYGYESLIINEFEGRGNISCLNQAGEQQEFCLADEQDVYDKLSFDPAHFYWNWGMMLLAIMIIYCLGYIGLVFRVYRAR